ncbi:MAG: ATP-binding cassette domain-containing protein [Proteobacteria bacterium]|nr:ATP-binding cassette domain-containing protein [Pseudomonadota bacterium]NIS72333.1 ATP-binding cassette domain-containing protein [Pseudomonadota bacterium]
MATSEIDVQVENLTKKFGDFTAVDKVSFSVPRGSFFSLLGPSGCGKTTILRMISGFETPTYGDVYIGGERVNEIPPNRRRTNLVFQNLALFPLKSVFENVAFGLRRRNVPRGEIRERVQKMLERVGLPGFENKAIHQLSGGQKQRVAIARCLVLEPTVLLLDEPLGALDLKLREHMKLELKKLQHRVGTTFIYITHDQGEAMTMSDQIAVMLRGRIVQIGAPEGLYNSPATSFVAAFVGDSNRLQGRVLSRHNKRVNVGVGPLEVEGVSQPGLEGESDALIFVRPQNVLIGSEADPIPEGYQAFPGLVREGIFEGAVSNYIVELAEGYQIKVVVPQASHVKAFSVEDRVQVAWSPDDTFCFSTEELGDITMSVGQE